MMSKLAEAKTDLETLHEKILAARDRLSAENSLHSHHDDISKELLARHKRLAQMLEDEIHDLEEHGIHVNAFDRAVLEWLNHSDFNKLSR
jgi:nucleotide-binding universal stress UspA family protein